MKHSFFPRITFISFAHAFFFSIPISAAAAMPIEIPNRKTSYSLNDLEIGQSLSYNTPRFIQSLPSKIDAHRVILHANLMNKAPYPKNSVIFETLLNPVNPHQALIILENLLAQDASCSYQLTSDTHYNAFHLATLLALENSAYVDCLKVLLLSERAKFETLQSPSTSKELSNQLSIHIPDGQGNTMMDYVNNLQRISQNYNQDCDIELYCHDILDNHATENDTINAENAKLIENILKEHQKECKAIIHGEYLNS